MGKIALDFSTHFLFVQKMPHYKRDSVCVCVCVCARACVRACVTVSVCLSIYIYIYRLVHCHVEKSTCSANLFCCHKRLQNLKAECFDWFGKNKFYWKIPLIWQKQHSIVVTFDFDDCGFQLFETLDIPLECNNGDPGSHCCAAMGPVAISWEHMSRNNWKRCYC
jgi:hypothetical protein